MWYDRRSIYTPSMQHRTRILPRRSWAILIVAALLIALAGDKLIHGFFWSMVHIGAWIVQTLGGAA